MTSFALALPLLVVAAQSTVQPGPHVPPRSAITVVLAPAGPSAGFTAAPANANPRTFEKLFVKPAPTLQTPVAPTPRDDRTGAPRVVCGMRLIPANPEVDAKIVLPPARHAVDPKIRRIVPDVCIE